MRRDPIANATHGASLDRQRCKLLIAATWMTLGFGLADAGCFSPPPVRAIDGGAEPSSGGQAGTWTGAGGEIGGTAGKAGRAGTAGTAGREGTAGTAGVAGTAGGGGGAVVSGSGGVPGGAGGRAETGGTAGRASGGNGGADGAAGRGGGGPNGSGGMTGSGGVSGPNDGGVDASRDAISGDARVCMAEQCNGRDDDCDGVVDDGCPIHQQPLSTRTVSMTSGVFGSLTQVRNTKFTDVCPDGQAIVGFIGNSASGLDALGVRCGTLQVREDRSSEPFSYSVAVAPGTDFAPVGGDGGSQHQIDSLLLCGPNEIVVSVTMTTEVPASCPANGCAEDTGNAHGCPAIYGMAVACARFNIAGSPGAFKLVRAGTPTMSARAGGGGRPSVPPMVTSFACSSTGVLRQINGTIGPWPYSCRITVVTGLQFACTEPTVPLR